MSIPVEWDGGLTAAEADEIERQAHTEAPGAALRKALLRIFDMAEARPDIRQVARAALAEDSHDGDTDSLRIEEDRDETDRKIEEFYRAGDDW